MLVILFALTGVLTCIFYTRKRYARSATITDWADLSRGVTDQKLERAWLRAVQGMYDTFVRKNRDYGAQNLSASGIIGIAVRIGDKVSRIWQLVGLRGQHTASVKEENIADTFLDLANYAVVGYLMASGSWPTSSISNVIGERAIAQLLFSVLEDLSEESQDELLAAFLTSMIAKDICVSFKVS